MIKQFILACAISACTIAPTYAGAGMSFGGHTLETQKAMSVFCQQAISDHKATNQQLTEGLKRLCL